MSWQAYFPIQLCLGLGVVQVQIQLLIQIGSRALIVLGQVVSVSRNVALSDRSKAVGQSEINWEMFNELETKLGIAAIRRGVAGREHP